ncbi:MAG: DUF3667 domain-containing protein [Flavobacteriales bacterium]
MENNQEISLTNCLNCGSALEGQFCNSCGQKTRDNNDRSIGPLLGDFLGNLFFVDSRFLLSTRYLLVLPGRMTVEFLEGKRKKFISPITLFLFFNLIYFIVSPLTDYSLSLEDQFYSQPYSAWIQDSVVDKIENGGFKDNTYGSIYQQMSDTISKSIMILNVPLMALLVFLMAFKRRRFYFDSLIFSLHFFSLIIFCPIIMRWVDFLIDCLPDAIVSSIPDITFELFCYVIPSIYAILSIKKFMNIKWYWSIPAGLWVVASVVFSNLIYRFIILWLTLWLT